MDFFIANRQLNKRKWKKIKTYEKNIKKEHFILKSLFFYNIIITALIIIISKKGKKKKKLKITTK